jgi:hypothetical protein
MIQVAAFSMPTQQDEANDFLRTHKPEGQVHFNRDMIVVFYDNGEVSPQHKIAEFQELLRGNENARFQQEVALFVLKRQRADLKEERSGLKANQNKGRVEQIDNLLSQVEGGIKDTENAMALQDVKADFVKDRITLLQRTIAE